MRYEIQYAFYFKFDHKIFILSRVPNELPTKRAAENNVEDRRAFRFCRDSNGVRYDQRGSFKSSLIENKNYFLIYILNYFNVFIYLYLKYF